MNMKPKLRKLCRVLVAALVVLLGARIEARGEEAQWSLSAAPVGTSATGPEKSTLAPSNAIGRHSMRTVASSLAVVLGVFLLLLALFRKQHQRTQGSSLMETLGQIQVAPKVKLHLVRFGSRLLVLHITPNSVQRVAEISDPNEVQQLLTDHNHPTVAYPQVDELLQAVDEARQSPSRGLIG
jgi:flagellar biogenesis protein FliO